MSKAIVANGHHLFLKIPPEDKEKEKKTADLVLDLPQRKNGAN